MRPRRPFRWSLTAQVAVVVAVFLAVPVILYKEFEAADRAKLGLLLQTVQDQGRTIAAAMAPLLTLKPNPAIALDEMLAELAGPRMTAKVLFRPASKRDPNAFYYIATSRKIDAVHMQRERDELARQGVLAKLNTACTLELPSAVRYRSPGGQEELITSVVPVLNAAGCWAVVTSYSDAALLASSLGQDYWNTTEMRIAAAIFVMSAILVLAMFFRLWRSLRRFSAVASEIRRGVAGGSFAARNTMPELAGVAAEFDRMVESLRKLSGAAEGSASPIVITDGDGRIEYANPALCALTGYAAEELHGRGIEILRAPDSPAEVYDALWATITRGEIWRGELCYRKKSGDTYWALVSISCLRDEQGCIDSYITVQEDITERKRAERQKALLLAELNHRVKNSLATVKSIAAQMLRQTTSLEAFKQSFEGRLQALSEGHDLLTRSNWEGADLGTVVARALKPFERSNPFAITAEGPPTMLIPRAALVLGMVFHELATNASKYGAMSVPGGKVSLSWYIEQQGGRERLILAWRERGGPRVEKPTKSGFGRTMIERGVAYELDGDVSLTYAPDGVECDIRLPWPIEADQHDEGDLAAAA